MDTPSSIASVDNLATCDDSIAHKFFHHSRAPRVDTDALLFSAIQAQHPHRHITIVPEQSCNLLAYAAAGHAVALPIDKSDLSPSTLKWRYYRQPSRRINGGEGGLLDMIFYGEYLYGWSDTEFYVYLIDGRDGTSSYPEVRNYYIVGAESRINEMIMQIGHFASMLRDEVWVFNQGYWQKDAELYENIMKSSWDDVILDAEIKKTVIEDAERFFDSKDIYQKLKVPWKRGVIYHGPPGNGKTISIKAMSHSLYSRKEPIPTLYVKTLVSYSGPEYSLGQIFGKARQQAPCLLVFEDLDSIVTDSIRSFFLNEVDGLANNDGILMIGSTNHLERLDPGISKRPSRFDRKFLFDDPTEEERVKYCEFWQRKLHDNKEIDFPHKLCTAIAKITDGFSFAYMQEAFVAALLAIAAKEPDLELFAAAVRHHRDRMEKTKSGENSLPILVKHHATSIANILVAIGLALFYLLSNKVFSHSSLTLSGALLLVTGMAKADEATYNEKRLLSDKSIVHDMAMAKVESDDQDLESYVLWRAIKKQVKILRDAIGDGSGSKDTTKNVGQTEADLHMAHQKGENRIMPKQEPIWWFLYVVGGMCLILYGCVSLLVVGLLAL